MSSVQLGWQGGAVVSTFASQQESCGFVPLQLTGLCLYVFTILVFFPLQITSTGYSNLAILMVTKVFIDESRGL